MIELTMEQIRYYRLHAHHRPADAVDPAAVLCFVPRVNDVFVAARRAGVGHVPVPDVYEYLHERRPAACHGIDAAVLLLRRYGSCCSAL